MKKLLPICALIWSIAAMARNHEEIYLEQSNRSYSYPGEKFKSVVVENFEELGKLTALRFLRFVEENPTGVVALPTGKTPQTFIAALRYYKNHWNDSRDELRNGSIIGETFPDTTRLRFVQLDEFFPFDPADEQSFTTYVRKNYIEFLKIAPENTLTMEGLIGPTIVKEGIETVFPDGTADLNLLIRTPKTSLEKLQKRALEEAQKFCEEYEEKIRKWGGISFFLGGIGTDGHVAFNLPWSMHDSTTRLIAFNPETAAVVAEDLGGIDRARGMLAATIGLGTIAYNPDVTAILFAATEAKSAVVAQSIEQEAKALFPATALQQLAGARFYLTKSAARDLKQRRFLDYQDAPLAAIPNELIDQTLLEISKQKRKAVQNLTEKDLTSTSNGQFLLERFKKEWKNLAKEAAGRIENKRVLDSRVDLKQ